MLGLLLVLSERIMMERSLDIPLAFLPSHTFLNILNIKNKDNSYTLITQSQSKYLFYGSGKADCGLGRSKRTINSVMIR